MHEQMHTQPLLQARRVGTGVSWSLNVSGQEEMKLALIN